MLIIIQTHEKVIFCISKLDLTITVGLKTMLMITKQFVAVNMTKNKGMYNMFHVLLKNLVGSEQEIIYNNGNVM